MTRKDKIPTIQSIMEGDTTPFGDEVSQISNWFTNEYDESYSFQWDGDNLKVLDGEKKDVETISRADLAGKIEGFPEKVAETKLNENYGDVMNDLKKAFDAAAGLMKGSSVKPKDMWFDLGIKLGFVTEDDADKLW